MSTKKKPTVTKRALPGGLCCSFCGKNQRQVIKMIAGPTVYICDECVELCVEIIRETQPAYAALSPDADVVKEANNTLNRTRATTAARIALVYEEQARLLREEAQALSSSTVIHDIPRGPPVPT